MNNQRVTFDKQYEQYLFQMYKYKYRKNQFSLIISADNVAFDFLRTYHQHLFPGVPDHMEYLSAINSSGKSLLTLIND